MQEMSTVSIIIALLYSIKILLQFYHHILSLEIYGWLKLQKWWRIRLREKIIPYQKKLLLKNYVLITTFVIFLPFCIYKPLKKKFNWWDIFISTGVRVFFDKDFLQPWKLLTWLKLWKNLKFKFLLFSWVKL